MLERKVFMEVITPVVAHPDRVVSDYISALKRRNRTMESIAYQLGAMLQESFEKSSLTEAEKKEVKDSLRSKFI
jgi:hypothetical protein